MYGSLKTCTFIEAKVLIYRVEDKNSQHEGYYRSNMYQEQLKKAYAKEINLNKLKPALLENMSHEIRTRLMLWLVIRK